MRIAIVDDLSADSERLRKLIECWAREQGIPLVPDLAVFESGEELLADFAPDTYDVIFLDIYMSGMTGMEAARKIRKQDEFCQLIFTTTTTEFAVDSYEVGAALLLAYPYFCDCMRGVLVNLEQVESLAPDHFVLQDKTDVPISRLKYREVREKYLTFTYARMRGGETDRKC